MSQQILARFPFPIPLLSFFLVSPRLLLFPRFLAITFVFLPRLPSLSLSFSSYVCREKVYYHSPALRTHGATVRAWAVMGKGRAGWAGWVGVGGLKHLEVTSRPLILHLISVDFDRFIKPQSPLPPPLPRRARPPCQRCLIDSAPEYSLKSSHYLLYLRFNLVLSLFFSFFYYVCLSALFCLSVSLSVRLPFTVSSSPCDTVAFVPSA